MLTASGAPSSTFSACSPLPTPPGAYLCPNITLSLCRSRKTFPLPPAHNWLLFDALHSTAQAFGIWSALRNNRRRNFNEFFPFWMQNLKMAANYMKFDIYPDWNIQIKLVPVPVSHITLHIYPLLLLFLLLLLLLLLCLT